MKNFYNSASPLNKLKWILGEDLLEVIKNERPELYNELLDYIANNKVISVSFC